MFPRIQYHPHLGGCYSRQVTKEGCEIVRDPCLTEHAWRLCPGGGSFTGCSVSHHSRQASSFFLTPILDTPRAPPPGGACPPGGGEHSRQEYPAGPPGFFKRSLILAWLPHGCYPSSELVLISFPPILCRVFTHVSRAGRCGYTCALLTSP